MTASLRFAAPLLISLPAACVMEPPSGEAGPCPVRSAGGWRAWVDLMPGPDRPRLWVVGKVTAPTGGYRVRLERGPVQEIDPPVQQLLLRVERPSGGATQAVVTHDLHADFPTQQAYGAVTVHCGSEILAEIRPVEQAH